MERTLFGKTEDGRNVEKLSFANGRYGFSVITYGASLTSFSCDDFNIVLDHSTVEGYEKYGGCLGAVIGPFANRIAGASFEVDGRRYGIEKNEKGNCLHSGSASFGRMVWSVEGIGESSVTLGLATPEGLGGFPGSHEIQVTYMLTSDGTLTISYVMSSSAKCPAHLTNHAYFNLSGSGTVLDHMLTVPADSYLEVNDENIPICVKSVEGTDFDFRIPCRVGARRDGRYDHCFALNSSCVLVAEGEKAILEMRTSEPGVQIYTGTGLKIDHTPLEGICFESGRFPDSPNRPDFPGAYSSPESPFTTSTSYRLRLK